MGTIKRVCKSSTSVKNTGTDSDLLFGITSMLFVVDKSFSFTLDDLGTDAAAVKFFKDGIHADRPDRIYPLFGNNVPIQGQTNNKGGDTTVTLDDGTPILLQYGVTSKVFYTTDGGLCLQKILQSFNNTDLRILEIDSQFNMAAALQSDRVTYKGLKPSSLFAPAPDLADFKNVAKTYFQLSYRPDIYLAQAKLISIGDILSDMLGLQDLDLIDAGGSTTAGLHVGVNDDCCDEPVSDSVLASIAAAGVTVFEAVDLADGTTVDITGVTVSGDHLVLAGTFVADHTYRVSGVDNNAGILYNNGAGLEGFEIAGSVDITVSA